MRDSPRNGTTGRSIRFGHGKGVHVSRREIGEGLNDTKPMVRYWKSRRAEEASRTDVINEAVCRLIRPDSPDEVDHFCVGLEAPVGNGDLRGGLQGCV